MGTKSMKLDQETEKRLIREAKWSVKEQYER
jgi:hypothetical protein